MSAGIEIVNKDKNLLNEYKKTLLEGRDAFGLGGEMLKRLESDKFIELFVVQILREIDRNSKEITKLKKALELANTQIAILLENSECRGDEDCDHCMAIGAQKQIKEIMEG